VTNHSGFSSRNCVLNIFKQMSVIRECRKAARLLGGSNQELGPLPVTVSTGTFQAFGPLTFTTDSGPNGISICWLGSIRARLTPIAMSSTRIKSQTLPRINQVQQATATVVDLLLGTSNIFQLQFVRFRLPLAPVATHKENL
jgi:hypothetical protein